MFNYYFILIDYNCRPILETTISFFFWCGYIAERKSWERVTAGSFLDARRESVHHMLPIEAKIENSSMLELFMTPAD